MRRKFGKMFHRFSSFNFQEKWAKEYFTKNPRQIPRATKRNSFTARLWELGRTKYKNKVLRQSAPESSPESLATSLSYKFFGVPRLSLNNCAELQLVIFAVLLPRAAQAQRESGVDFCPGNPKSLNQCSVVVPLEVPRTEMVSLQLLVDRYANRVKHPEKPLGKKFPKMAWIWEFWVAWIWRGFLGTGKKGLKNPRQIHASFRNKICTVVCGNPCPNPCRKIKKSTASSHPSSSALARSSVLSSRTERPLANALSL